MLGHRLTWLVVAYITVGQIFGGRVPEIPSGRRTQYLFLLDNGGYKYGYDTGLGAAEKALATENNEVKGTYSYQSPSGPVSVEYTSGVEGFKPNKVVVPPASAGSYAKTSSVQYGSTSGSSFNSNYGVAGGNQYVAPVNVAAYNQRFPSGSAVSSGYSFSYNAGDHSRTETADPNGNVVGSFSFLPKGDSALRTVNYEAGAEMGFVAKGSHLPSAGFSGHAAYGSASQADSDSDSVSVNAAGYSADAGTSDGSGTGDASYAFSYNAGDHTRQESADAKGNVVGSFSFVPKGDSALRTVNYEAGAEKGFVATGSHLPSTGAGAGSYSPAQTPFSNGANSPVTYSASSGSNDGSYSFSYNAGDHSRQENADGNGNVVGGFSFVPKGESAFRTVTYEAGAGKGFVATGAHLPTAPTYTAVQSYTNQNVQPAQFYTPQTADTADSTFGNDNSDKSYAFSYSTADHSRHESSDSNGNVVGSFSFVPKDDGVQRTVNYQAGSATGFVASGAHVPSVSAPSHAYSGTASYSAGNQGTAAADGSYSFSYNAGDHSRHESADSQGNVAGTFSFVPKDDGVARKVDYVAGAELGFVARGSHLPTQPAQVNSYQSVLQKQTPSAGQQFSYSGNHQSGQGGLSSSNYGYQESDESGTGDASYSFSYNAGDHTRQESSDAGGNVVGTFSFVGKDGQSKTVDYQAGAEKGFVAKGAHLPENQLPLASAGVKSAAGGFQQYSSGYSATPVQYLPPSKALSLSGSGSIQQYSLGNVNVKTFLTPNAHRKVGYVYDS